MELNGVGAMNAYQEISGTGFNRQVQEDNEPPPFPGNGADLDISRSGKMMNAMSRMSEEEKSEMKAFHDDVMEAVENGTFDASELAASAPESLVNFAEENDLDLEQMIEGMAQGPQGHKGAPPPPPPMMYGADGKGITFDDDNEDELQSVLLSGNTGTIEQS